MTTPALVRLDTNDPTLPEYMSLDRPRDWAFVAAEQQKLSSVYNGGFRFCPDLDWYGFLADDVVPETPEFDKLLVKAAVPDGLAFGDDSANGPDHATHFVLGGDLVRSCGFLSVPGLSRIYIDTAWNDIAHDRGVHRYLPHVKMTHEHFSNRRSLLDKTYRKPDKARDREIYDSWHQAFFA